MHANMDIARFLIEGREEQYLRHFFRDFAYKPNAISEEEIAYYVMQMRQPGNLRASLNHYAFIPEKAAQLAAFAKKKLDIPLMGWGGRRSFAEHCYESVKALSDDTTGGVIEDCGHWVFEEQTDFINQELATFWGRSAQVTPVTSAFCLALLATRRKIHA